MTRVLSLAALLMGASTPGALTGDQLLAQATAAPGLQSYTVPVHFDLHLQRPIGTRAGADGTVYYQAPGQGALVITKSTGLIGLFFKGNYHIDLVPQAWAADYRVISVGTTTDTNGVSTTLLTAVPRIHGEDVEHVVFRIDDREDAAVAATWTYKNGSTIALTFVNGQVGAYTLAQRGTVSVDRPSQKLDARATYGSYALNAPVDQRVFINR